MQLKRILATVIVAMIVTAGIARADAWIYGKEGLLPDRAAGEHSGDCSKLADGFRCNIPKARGSPFLYFSKKLDPLGHNKKHCTVQLSNQGSVYIGDKWRVGNVFGSQCKIDQTSTNNIFIYPPK